MQVLTHDLQKSILAYAYLVPMSPVHSAFCLQEHLLLVLVQACIGIAFM